MLHGGARLPFVVLEPAAARSVSTPMEKPDDFYLVNNFVHDYRYFDESDGRVSVAAREPAR